MAALLMGGTGSRLMGSVGGRVFNSQFQNRRRIEQVAASVVESAFKVHCGIGPGLLESAYEKCLAFELRKAGHHVECQVNVPLIYEDVIIDAGYRLDMLIDGLVIVENKTAEILLPIHAAQLLTYLRLTGMKLGFLINWNAPLLRDGIRRYVNNL